jgi:protoporphyrinogen oxidase
MQKKKRSNHITILGGGLAGLAVGYYAKKQYLPFTVYEASSRVGGNAITLHQGEFRFDSGAHRLHDKDPEVTAEIKLLLGESLKQINIPSQIYHQGKLITFPLLPLNLIKNLGIATCAKAGLQVATQQFKRSKPHPSFEHFARNTYGDTISNGFLLNYSEKLWGIPCNRLSPYIAGKRLKGLSLKTFLLESLNGKNATAEHVEGRFYYPQQGIGMIADKLAAVCGEQKIIAHADNSYFP